MIRDHSRLCRCDACLGVTRVAIDLSVAIGATLLVMILILIAASSTLRIW